MLQMHMLVKVSRRSLHEALRQGAKLSLGAITDQQCLGVTGIKIEDWGRGTRIKLLYFGMDDVVQGKQIAARVIVPLEKYRIALGEQG